MNSGRYLEEVLIEMSDAGATSFLIAEAARDALLEPPNLELLRMALTVVDDDVIAAGGVRHLDDLRDVISTTGEGRRIKGVIVGREVTHGRFTLDQARAVLAEPPTVINLETEPPPEPPALDPAVVEAVKHYQLLADELDRAAAHARSTAQRLAAGEVARGHSHGLTTVGHLRKAQRMMDDLAIGLADRRTE